MATNTSIRKNYTYQMLYQILVWLLPIVTSPYISRVIGAEGVGIFSYSYSTAYYFVLFSMLGLSNYGNRVIAQCTNDQSKLDKKFSSIFGIHFVVSIICLVIYEIYVFFIAQKRLYAFIQSAYVLSALFDISWFYFGIEKFKLTVLRSTIIKILNFACIFIFVRSAEDLWKYCLIIALGTLVNQLALWIPLKKYVKFSRPIFNEMIIHLKPLFVLFVPAIAVSLYKYMDKIMIGNLNSTAQLGYYENAEKMVNVPLMMITSFGTVMLPRMSHLVALNNFNSINRYINLSMKYIMCLAFSFSFGLAAVGKVFAPLFWGSDFSLSGILMMGLSITIPFITFANIIRTQYLIPQKKDKDYLISVCVGAVVNIVINALLIHSYGAIGATIGTIAAEIVVCIIQAMSVKSELNIYSYIKSFVPFLIFGVFMFLCVYVIGELMEISFITLGIQVIVGITVYIVLCLWYFTITKDDVIMRSINRFKGVLFHKK